MDMLNTIHWGYVALAVLAIGIAVSSPFLMVLFRSVRAIAYTSSDDFRLRNANMWTEPRLAADGGSYQLMRLEDGNFVLISVGVTTLKVFVTPDQSDMTHYRELKEFALHNAADRFARSAQQRHAEDLLFLERVRRAIAWPSSIGDLTSALQAIDNHLLLDATRCT